jgi:hypothetical protein
VREAVRDYMNEAGKTAPAPEREREVEPVKTVTQPVAAPVQEPEAETVVAEAPVAQAEPVMTAPSEPVAVQAPGQQWQGSPTEADTAGAELTAYVPGVSVAAIEHEASELTEATLDAPVRLATTGAEAAALTAAAGALVIGGAGSLLAARRSRVRV